MILKKTAFVVVCVMLAAMLAACGSESEGTASRISKNRSTEPTITVPVEEWAKTEPEAETTASETGTTNAFTAIQITTTSPRMETVSPVKPTEAPTEILSVRTETTTTAAAIHTTPVTVTTLPPETTSSNDWAHGAWLCDDEEEVMLLLFRDNGELEVLMRLESDYFEDYIIIENGTMRYADPEFEEYETLTDITRSKDLANFRIYMFQELTDEGHPDPEGENWYYVLDRNDEIYFGMEDAFDYAYEATGTTLRLIDNEDGSTTDTIALQFVDDNTIYMDLYDEMVLMTRAEHLDALLNYIN